MISYNPLFETMKKKNISTYKLINQYKINPRTVHGLKKGQSITVYTMEKLCHILECKPNDIVEFLPDIEK
ncbi:MAG: helix-turn-helix domain-containing protein [Coprobacillus sp.]